MQLKRVVKLNTQLDTVQCRRTSRARSDARLELEAWLRLSQSLLGKVAAHANTRPTSEQAARPASWRAAHPRSRLDETHEPRTVCSSMSHSGTLLVNENYRMHGTNAASLLGVKQRSGPAARVPPNPSIEGTCSGLRPPHAPHVKR